MNTGQPPSEGTYVLWLKARQSGETDILRLFGDYYSVKPNSANQSFWVPYGSGGFSVSLSNEYYMVKYIGGWVGPLEWSYRLDIDKEMQPWFGTKSIGINKGEII